MSPLNVLGLAVVIIVNLLVVAFSTWCAFALLRRVERFLLRDAADDKPGLAGAVGRLAVGLFVTTFILVSVAAAGAGPGGGASRRGVAPPHAGTLPELLAGPVNVRKMCLAVVVMNWFVTPIVMVFSVALGMFATIVGIRRKNKRAKYYGIVSLLMNGLFVFLLCGVVMTVFWPRAREQKLQNSTTARSKVPGSEWKNFAGDSAGSPRWASLDDAKPLWLWSPELG